MDEIHEEMDYAEKYSIPAAKKPGRPKKLTTTKNSTKSSFTCKDCGSTFAQKEKLKDHQKGENCSGHKPEEQEGENGGKYFCDGCGASFARKGNLARHKSSSCTVFGQNEQVRLITIFALVLINNLLFILYNLKYHYFASVRHF